MSEFDQKARDWDTPQKQQRAAEIAKAIRATVPLTQEMAAFEYGCGTGQLSFELREDVGAIVLADTSEGMLEVLREKIAAAGVDAMTALNLDLATQPLPDARFDLIYSAMTLHHIPDTEQILGQFSALLNPGGYLCIADLDQEDGSFHGHDAHHVHRGFARPELRKLAEAAGFTDIAFSDAFEVKREVGQTGQMRAFSVFLMVGKKA
ncbi:class I SAM-dependent methyltransferase [Bradymonas sediminis]|uniref:Class I SAM-dependent methyltransferase n=1 Tax=Bradymonas sediminis TaxID=1548548 RepID=A0A2Z4FQ59_9DELT|nr:class I SAM-dependent methyltransferase [Bradymonas sediminis]AWV91129.1 class I SAM-dependent methyltransferase [Bradymonas sediminis]TDP73686.1 methyltransferase family protein [Bradymonas sediminis]